MPSHGTFTLTDSAAATHVFTRVNINGSNVRFQDRSTPSALGWMNVETNLRPPLAGNGPKVYKETLKVTMPITVDEVINGVTVPKVVRTHVCEITNVTPADSPETERELFSSLVADMLANATIKDLTVQLLPLNGSA
jgi:hypothetical protein